MASKQETLIYIEDENIKEAEFMSRSFVDKELKNRAYLNALAAELAMKYLASEGIKIEDLHNIHSISKIIESIDIADIQLPNIHIDVRLIWNENQIFIPKSHFELDIKPDIYMVLKLEKDLKYVEFLGYFKPQQINLKNENDDYYFFPKNKLSSPDSLKKFIDDFTGSTTRDISQEDMLRGRELSISLADHNLTEDETKEFLELLLSSDSLRESVLEFDNFETLAFNVASKLNNTKESSETFTLLPAEDEEHVTEEETDDSPFDTQYNTEPQTFTILPDDEQNNSEPELNNQDINLSQTQLTDDDFILDESFFNDDETDQDSTENETTDSKEEDNTTNEEEQIEEKSNETQQEETPVQDEKLEYLNTEDNVVQDSTDDTFDSSDILDTSNNQENLLDFDNIDLGDELLDDNIGINNDKDSDTSEIENIKNEIETTTQEENLPLLSEDFSDLGDDLLDDDISPLDAGTEDLTLNTEEEEENNSANNNSENTETNTTSEETINSQTHEQEEAKSQKPQTDLAQTITSALKDSIEKTAATAAATSAIAAAATSATTEAISTAAEVGAIAAEKTSEKAIKLASVAGDLVNDIVNKNLEEQQKNLDRIDYAKSTTNANDVPEHIAALAQDLSTAKIEINLEAEASGQFESPKDLSDLKVVENNHKEEAFEQETVELGNMETVQTETFHEDTDSIVNLENLHAIDSPTKPIDNLEEKTKSPEIDKIDLPDLSTFEIKEDGTSTFDNFATDINYNNEEEHLMDFNMPSNEITIDDSEPINFGTTTSDSSDLDFGDNLFDENIANSEDLTIEEPPLQNTANDNSIENSNNQPEFDATQTFDSSNEEQNNSYDDMEDINAFLNDEIDITEDTTTQDEIAPEIQENIEDINNNSIEEINTETQPEQQIIQDDLIIDDSQVQDSTTINQTVEEQTTNTTTEEPENAQDWLNDTNYDDLQDVEIPQQTEQNELSEVDITEPEPNQKVFNAQENSTVISDKTFKVGEIPIDINNPNVQKVPESNENLEDLYNPDSKVPGSALLQNPGRLGSTTGNKAGLGIGLKLVGGLVTLAIVCAIGFGVAKMFKTPTEETPQPVTDDNVPTSPDNGVAENNTLNVNPDNVVNMENNTNTLATTNPTKQETKNTTKTDTKVQNQPQTTLTPAQKKSIKSTTFIEVKKLTWEIPDYISYNQQFKQYFQAAGKSLKLSLTSDLLLATDYAYANEIRVSVTFNKDGSFKNAQIITSSGSSQIDNIVLQTVNQTLKVLKAPHSVGNDESTTAILKIYL